VVAGASNVQYCTIVQYVLYSVVLVLYRALYVALLPYTVCSPCPLSPLQAVLSLNWNTNTMSQE
jgi:hypothetical protein